MKKVTLYVMDQNKSIRVWSISGLINFDGEGEITIEHGVLGGEINRDTLTVEEGLAGRTIEEQMLLRIDSRINSKLNGGYVREIEEAREGKRLNPLGYERAMTAKTFKSMAKQINFDKGVYIQRKYNGHRCLSKNNNGNIVPYSRNGKIVNSIDHIVSELMSKLPEGITVDGELYHHGTKFQTISSWIKKKQIETRQLKYVVYDSVCGDDYAERLIMLKELFDGSENIVVAETQLIHTLEDARNKLDIFISEGYEGAMLRMPFGFGYEDGKRSKSLIKMKKFLDDEFLVVDIVSSAEGWGLLSCLSKTGKRFSVSAPGSKFEKTQILKNKDKYIGLYAQVEYAELTLSGKPFHPVCVGFRDKGSE